MRVNLLPPEVRRARRDAAVLHRIRFLGLAALVLLAGLYAIRTTEAFFLRGQLADLQREQAVIQENLLQLAEVAAARDAVAGGEALAAQLLRGDIAWSAQLLRLSEVIPPGFTLTSFAGSATTAQASGLAGSVTFSAVSRDLIPTQTWLVRLASQDVWTNEWISSVTEEAGGLSVSGSFDLTPLAISARGGGPA